MWHAINHNRLVGNVADLVRNGHDLHMWCLACRACHLWRYDWMAAKLGEGFVLSEWSARYRCPGCGLVGVSELQVSVRQHQTGTSSIEQLIAAGVVKPLTGRER